MNNILKSDSNVNKPVIVGEEDPCKIEVSNFPKRDWLVGPLEYKGDTYKARIFEFKW